MQNELAGLRRRGGQTAEQWQAAQPAYLGHIAAQGRHPRLAEAIAQDPAPDSAPEDPLDLMTSRIMEGILGSATSPTDQEPNRR
jgi:hypothetical protein